MVGKERVEWGVGGSGLGVRSVMTQGVHRVGWEGRLAVLLSWERENVLKELPQAAHVGRRGVVGAGIGGSGGGGGGGVLMVERQCRTFVSKWVNESCSSVSTLAVAMKVVVWGSSVGEGGAAAAAR